MQRLHYNLNEDIKKLNFEFYLVFQRCVLLKNYGNKHFNLSQFVDGIRKWYFISNQPDKLTRAYIASNTTTIHEQALQIITTQIIIIKSIEKKLNTK